MLTRRKLPALRCTFAVALVTTSLSASRLAATDPGLWSLAGAGPVEEFPTGLAVGADGNLAFAAISQAAPQGLYHATLTRIDPFGQLLWAKSYGGSGTDWPESIVATPGGGFVVAGSTSSFGLGQPSGWVFATDAAGALLWQKAYTVAGAVGSRFDDIWRLRGGGYLLVGTIAFVETEEGGEIWVQRIDDSGGVVWSRRFGGDPVYEGMQALERRNGELLVVGSDLDGHALLLDLDPSGNLLWQKSLDQFTVGELSVAETADGGLVLGGEQYATSGFDRNLVVARLDAAGAPLWSRSYGSSNLEFAGRDLMVLPDGSFLVPGTTEAQIGPNEYQRGLLLRLSASGELLLQEALSSGDRTSFRSLARGSDGAIYAAGHGSPHPGGWHWSVSRLSGTGEIGSGCAPALRPVTIQDSPLTLAVGTPSLAAASLAATAVSTSATATPTTWTLSTTCTAATPAAACTADATSLCLGDHRFRVSASWDTPAGLRGAAQAVTLTRDTGYFWFFDPANVELILKTLDGCGVNSAYWVFAGGLTNVHVALSVTDTATGLVKAYDNPANTPFRPIQDTSAFSTCSALTSPPPLDELSGVLGADEPAETALEELSASSGSCVPSSTVLCLNNGRFKVETTWRLPSGAAGAAHPLKLTADTGTFWFFSASNVELVVKVLNGCGVGGHYWVFAGGLTDVATVVKVTDTTTGAVQTYTNPPGVQFQPIQDTSAFASCP
ncbi:MAG: hypothetical protein IPJ17_17790 [Holophagales bacterium]|nr:MAG: hypothetical protein IPJ17_17790 [Holophagales bacterium]